jgi:hypothetical protein
MRCLIKHTTMKTYWGQIDGNFIPSEGPPPRSHWLGGWVATEVGPVKHLYFTDQNDS